MALNTAVLWTCAACPAPEKTPVVVKGEEGRPSSLDQSSLILWSCLVMS